MEYLVCEKEKNKILKNKITFIESGIVFIIAILFAIIFLAGIGMKISDKKDNLAQNHDPFNKNNFTSIFLPVNAESEKNNTENVSSCNYYKVDLDRIKKDFMDRLSLNSEDELNSFLKSLKDSDTLDKFRANKKISNYDLGELVYGVDSDGNKVESKLARYSKDSEMACKNDSETLTEIKRNIEIINILAQGFKSPQAKGDSFRDYINTLKGKDYWPEN